MTARDRRARVLPTQEARGGSRPGLLLPVATALALILASVPVSVLFTDGSWLPVVILTVAAVCGTGGVLRALPVPLIVVPFAQTAAFASVMSWFLVRPSSGNPFAAVSALAELTTAGVAAVRETVAPVDASPQTLALLAVLVFLVALLVETLAVGLGLAGLAGVALLLFAAAPLGINPSGPLPLLLAAPALGWLLLLAADQSVRLHPVRKGPPAGAARSWLTTVALAATGIVATSAVLAVAAPSAAETPWLRNWWNDVTAKGSAEGSSLDPFVGVRARIEARSDERLLQYDSSDGSPTYLRLVTLEAFDGEVWSPYPPSPSVDLQRPAPDRTVGSGQGPTYEITVGSLENLYLPVPDGVSAVAMPDDAGWGWDVRTGDAVSSARVATGLQYRASTSASSPTAQALAEASSDSPQASRTTRALPPGMPFEVADIAAEVTSGAVSNYEAALALQSWFTSEGGFTYSLNVPDPGVRDPLLAFLTDRVGFCQQYATAMAVMSRTLGIPARVVVGFTGGSPGSDGTFVVTGADAHAWPELWFDGIGWVRFEPTPAAASAAVVPPAYSGPQESAEPSAPPSQAPATSQPEVPSGTSASQGSQSDLYGPAGLVLRLLAVAAVLAALVLAPRLLRSARRRSRWAQVRDGQATAGWAEIADAAIDAGIDWPAQATMRIQAASVIAALQTGGSDAAVDPAPDPAEAVWRLVAAAEEHLYAPSGGQPSLRAAASSVIVDEPRTATADAAADVQQVVDALDRLPRASWRRVVPTSLLQR